MSADLSCPEWIWIPGPETLPKVGSAMPRLGLGVLVDRRLFSAAAAVSSSLLCTPLYTRRRKWRR
jgi:hypothetical protein